MDYRGKRIAITGASGFIGQQLLKRLTDLVNDGQTVIDKEAVTVLTGDVRDKVTFATLDQRYDYLFHFGAPSSQVLFKRQPAYCIESTIQGFMNAADVCRRHGIRLIYPSTGLLSSGKFNEYAMCKKICEDYAAGLGIDSLGLRIFATYGPGEGHKADYASVPYLFARDIVAGRQPIVFGDGEQVRDFIYIDDVIEATVRLAEECHDPVIDVGSGEQTSFNKIIFTIGDALAYATKPPKETRIDTEYVKAPAGYVKETVADTSRLHDYYVPGVQLHEGIKRLVDHLKERVK